MSLLKKVRCTQGHIHEVYSVGELIMPYYCTVEEMLEASRKAQRLKPVTFSRDPIESQELPKRSLQAKSPMILCSHNNKTPNTPTEKGKAMKTTEDLHQDSRPTVVLIGDQVYDLILSETWNKQNLNTTPPPERPHVRYLNAIPVRTKEEQKQKNLADKHMHKLCEQIPQEKSTPLAKVKKNLANGANYEMEVKKLLGMKAKATKEKDEIELRRIRKALRKLGYKKYAEQSKEA